MIGPPQAHVDRTADAVSPRFVTAIPPRARGLFGATIFDRDVEAAFDALPADPATDACWPAVSRILDRVETIRTNRRCPGGAEGRRPARTRIAPSLPVRR